MAHTYQPRFDHRLSQKAHTRSASSCGVLGVSLIAVVYVYTYSEGFADGGRNCARAESEESILRRVTCRSKFSFCSPWTPAYLGLAMFLGRLLSTVQTFVAPSATRLFSTTSAVEAGYKMKSHSGAKKRWRSLASGSDFKRVSLHSTYFLIYPLMYVRL